MATPIRINGEHAANFFIGQFFLEDSKPDLEQFRAKAKFFGFDEEAYLEAINRVPIYKEEEIKRHMDFLCRLVEMIGEVGAKTLAIEDLNRELTGIQVSR